MSSQLVSSSLLRKSSWLLERGLISVQFCSQGSNRLYKPIFAKNIFKDAFFAKFLSLILTV
jgi:hypothetical protein